MSQYDDHEPIPRDIDPGVGCAVFALMLAFYTVLFMLVKSIWGV